MGRCRKIYARWSASRRPARVPTAGKGRTPKGRKAKRQVNEVTFHSLRHSLVTMLKATGASNALAQMIVGHGSAAVSARYTHLSADDTADSRSKLPDVTR
jgi:integrase